MSPHSLFEHKYYTDENKKFQGEEFTIQQDKYLPVKRFDKHFSDKHLPDYKTKILKEYFLWPRE